MPTMLDQPTESAVRRKQLADEAERRRVISEEAIRMEMEGRQQQLDTGKANLSRVNLENAKANRESSAATMASDAAQWAGADPYKSVEFGKAPPEVRQHFMSAYPDVAAEAPAAWNRAQAQTNNFIPGLENMQVKGAVVDKEGNRSTSYEPRQPDSTELDDDQQKIVEAIGSYNQDPRQTLSRFHPEIRQRIMAAVQTQFPHYDAKEFAVKQQSRKDFTSGVSARNIVALNTAVNHLKGLLDAHKALNNRSVTGWNSISNEVSSQLGSPAIKAFDTNAEAVAAEMARVLTGAAPTVSSIAEQRKNFHSNMSPAQMKAAVDKALELMGGRVNSLHEQWQSAFDKPRDMQFLSPQSRKILQDIGYNPDALDPVHGSSETAPEQPTQPVNGTDEYVPIHSQAEYDALPVGAKYQDSHGKKVTKQAGK